MPEPVTPEAPVLSAERQPQMAEAAETVEKKPRRRRRRTPRAEEVASPVAGPVADLAPGVETEVTARSPNGSDVEAAQPHATWPEPEAPQAGWPEPQDLEPVPLTPPLASPQDRLSAAPSLEDAEAEESEDGAVPPASMVDRDAGEPPRRGWWSRFVRKED
jgi:hypothetical protein